MGEAARYFGKIAAAQDVQPLPQAFADCETLVTSARLGADANLLTDILTPDALERGFASIMGRWGPGDRRAAVSLWSQGYFSRLLRPWLAYGLLHGRWFSTRPEHLSVALSPLLTPAKFSVTFRPLPAGEAMQELLSCHLEPLVTLLSTRTGTSAKLHWGNAAFPLHRMFRSISAMTADLAADPERTARIAEIGERLSADQPFGRMVRLVSQPDAQPVLQRRICCMRYRLNGLAKCKSACPIADD